jgi:sulfite exporter TauE/SafE
MDTALIALSLLLLLHLLRLTHPKESSCRTPAFLKDKSPLLMGFFMGINLCPPFLLSVAYVFKQQSPFYGMLYFALFFLSSSVYFLPLVFIGLLSKTQEFRNMARLSGWGVAIIFFIYGVYSILHNV